MGLGIALTSYAGTMGIGFNSDPDIVPDLELFVERFVDAMKAVAQAARVDLGPVSADVREIQAALN
jgi:hypothetical protein